MRGIDIRLNTRITSVDWLVSQGYDAAFLAISAQCGLKLGIEGEKRDPGIIDGISFLREVNSGIKPNSGARSCRDGRW